MSKTTYTLIQFSGMPFWTRVRMGLSMALTPFTVILMGRSMKVEWEQEGVSIEEVSTPTPGAGP